MSADKNSQINKNPHWSGDSLASNVGGANHLIDAMDMLKRDRFELLSAYLDGEVTACERRQVEDWLANDPESQRLYGRLLTLRQGLQTMPVPSTQQSVENTIEQVYQRMHRRSRHRAAVWGGSAIAALVIGAISTVLPGRQVPQFAQSPTTSIEPLMVALNNPVVEIPRGTMANPEKPSLQITFPQQQSKDFN